MRNRKSITALNLVSTLRDERPTPLFIVNNDTVLGKLSMINKDEVSITSFDSVIKDKVVFVEYLLSSLPQTDTLQFLTAIELNPLLDAWGY